jgi:hypothetical protein
MPRSNDALMVIEQLDTEPAILNRRPENREDDELSPLLDRRSASFDDIQFLEAHGFDHLPWYRRPSVRFFYFNCMEF